MTHFHATWTIPAALALLPPRMDTPSARACLVAIGLQESEFRARRQGRGGPARGFWQFEFGGALLNVLTHARTKAHALTVCEALAVTPAASACFDALEHNDVLAAAFARLQLWQDPSPLPAADDPAAGWRLYLDAWRPGQPRPATWSSNYRRAWAAITGDDES